ncbi:MAG TPA: cysteine desulfurase [Candidatus Nanoarchaeia archaeon]|nr:cysteine desulfurase [Candidatus Nanoarchaeia archaeon]
MNPKKDLKQNVGKAVQADFPLLKKVMYLDNASTTLKPKVVLQAMNDYYLNYTANVHRGVHKLSQEATLAFEQAHEIVAEFIHAEPEEIIFTSGATESINLLAQSLGKSLKPGDEIVLSQMEHHSNLVPWQQIAKEKKAVLKYIPITKDFRLDMTPAKKLITSKTKIVSITHMSNVLGTINPVSELATLAHKVNAIMVVDAAQSAPHIPLDVKKLNCDFLVFSAHKLCGPTGTGILYGKKELLLSLTPSKYGGGMIQEVTWESSTWADLPDRFEAGTPNIAGAIGLAAAIRYLQNRGMEAIKTHEKMLTEYALKKITKIPGLKIIGPSESKDRGGVISFTIPGIHPHDVGEILDRSGIAIRAGHHCAMPLHDLLGISGTSRMSFYFYNTKEEIDAAVNALRKVQKIFQ